MKLSVIIPSYNAAETIACQLDALVNQQWSQPWEIIIADNGSTDNTRKIVEDYIETLPNLRIIDASGRRGAAHARNMGAQAAKGEALAFCDADDEVGTDWVRAMGEALLIYDFIACRLETSKLNILPEQSYLGHHQRDGLLVLGFSPHLPYAGAGALGIKRSVHESIGGFDESLLRIEDADYCIRVQRAGVELHYVPEALNYCRRRSNMAGIMFQGFSWAFYSVLIYKRHRMGGVTSSGGWRQSIRACVDLCLQVYKLLSPAGRVQWIWQFSWRLGILLGCLVHRVNPPFFDSRRSALQPSSTKELMELV